MRSQDHLTLNQVLSASLSGIQARPMARILEGPGPTLNNHQAERVGTMVVFKSQEYEHDNKFGDQRSFSSLSAVGGS